MKLNKLYEQFHHTTRPQLTVINGDNFTYHLICKVLDTYVQSGKVLDIGCGVGTVSFYLAQRGRQVVGIDISQNAVEACIRNAKILKLDNKTKFYQMDFPYSKPKETFDVVTCIEVIEHLKDDTKALDEIFSLLKPGGITIISTPSSLAPLHRLGLTWQFDKRVGHLRRYTLEDLENKVKHAGFTILEKKKTEGIVRNFLFTNAIAGKLVRLIKWQIVSLVSFIDNVSLKLFGESDLFIIARKPL